MSVVELRSVSKRHGEVLALERLDLVVRRGEVVAILGPNGAGKSTLFELLLGLLRPSAGRVRVLGRPPGERSARRRIGAMLQGAGLPEQVRVEELVRLLRSSYPSGLEGDEALRRVGLQARRRHRVETLSGGERQRLLLAMAIVGAPALLLLDEPTVAMDVAARRRFWDQARASVERGATLLFATHDLREADAVADRVVLLHRGRVLADAAPAELKRLVPGHVVTLVTDAPPERIEAWPGVERVVGTIPAPSPPLRRLVVSAVDATCVVVPLVRAGHRLVELAVTQPDLETAFTQLTAAGDTGTGNPGRATA
jgi:ABC-2 type transport system ATP-binding protein